MQIEVQKSDISAKKNLVLAYISDLHLDLLIANLGLSLEDETEIKNCFRDMIVNMYDSIPTSDELITKVIFVGDICFNKVIFKLFFQVYRDLIFDDTFVVLGNHELWNIDHKYPNIDANIKDYRALLSELTPSITLLDDQLWFPNKINHTLSRREIVSLTKKDINKLFSDNDYAIFGSTGYSGVNENFNSQNNIYGYANLTRNEEVLRSQQTDDIHTKLSRIAGNRNIYFATHMPLSDWSKSKYNTNWKYLHGHTHLNFCCVNSEKQIYANNQIVNPNRQFKLKFIISPRCVKLDFYSDGIHTISRSEYIAINSALGIHFSFNREIDTIYMVKRCGLYMFFATFHNYRSLKILCGGQIENAKHDLQYYYDNICNYSESINKVMAPYYMHLEKISEVIKTLGGSGYVHGSIVDIDFFSHIFINPFDGTLLPYYATSIVDKYVYPNFSLLLNEHRPDLLVPYNELKNKTDMVLYSGLNSSLTNGLSQPIHYTETKMYNISLVVKKLQFIKNNGVVRLWNDAFLNKSQSVFPQITPFSSVNDNFSRIDTTTKSNSKEKVKKIKNNKKSERLLSYELELTKYSPHLTIQTYNNRCRQVSYKCSNCNHIWDGPVERISDTNLVRCPKCKK